VSAASERVRMYARAIVCAKHALLCTRHARVRAVAFDRLRCTLEHAAFENLWIRTKLIVRACFERLEYFAYRVRTELDRSRSDDTTSCALPFAFSLFRSRSLSPSLSCLPLCVLQTLYHATLCRISFIQF